MERRKCEVEGEVGYFHTWEHFADTIEFSRVYGIVEFGDGSVKRVDPTKIIFKESTEEGDLYRGCDNCIYQYLPVMAEPCISCGQSMNRVNWKGVNDD